MNWVSPAKKNAASQDNYSVFPRGFSLTHIHTGAMCVNADLRKDQQYQLCALFTQHNTSETVIHEIDGKTIRNTPESMLGKHGKAALANVHAMGVISLQGLVDNRDPWCIIVCASYPALLRLINQETHAGPELHTIYEGAPEYSLQKKLELMLGWWFHAERTHLVPFFAT